MTASNMTRQTITPLVIGAVLVVLAALVPYVANGYWLSIALTAMMYICLLYTSDAADE